MKHLCAILGALWCFHASAAEVIPPTPAHYFNDYANVVSAATASQLNRTLEDFERRTSSQILVVVYPKMQSDSSIEDYTVRVFRAWGVGQTNKNNGAVLFVFTQDHRMRIATGYGLEGALPDALCKRILDDEITPRFRAGDYAGGLTAGVNAMMAATRGEYRGTGRTANDLSQNTNPAVVIVLFLFFFALVVIVIVRIARRSGGWSIGSGGSSGWTGSSWSSGGWSGGGGGDWSSGGGGFSGGGGSTGGGGASGSW